MIRLVALGFFASLAKGQLPDDPCTGGACYTTSHSLREPVALRGFDEEASGHGVIREYHFHTYWHVPTGGEGKNDSFVAAMRLRSELIQRVKNNELIAVCDGVTADVLPGLPEDRVPGINEHAVGPHPAGSFETWVPAESLAATLSFFINRRGELSILIHPLSKHSLEDHTGRAMWLGPSWRINLNVLTNDDDEGGNGGQYPELGLGYAAPR